MVDCPYRRIRGLGEGAVGSVHLCLDVEKRRLIVVKWLKAEVHEQSEAAARFAREAERMAQAHIAGVIEVQTYAIDARRRTWMAMEFVDGAPPSQAIGPGDVWGTHQLLLGVGRSLDEMHGLGIVHRDLKPDNVLLRNHPRDGWEPVIIDLGIAKFLDEDVALATATGSVFGTPHYMSPEQLRDTKHVGPATDRYALAVIAYELLTGDVPFDGRTLPELLYQHTEAPVPPLALRGVAAAPRLDAFMRKAMAKRPDERFTSGAELAEAFERAARADGAWQSRTVMPLFEPLEHPRVAVTLPSGQELEFDLRQGPIAFGRHEACQVIVPHARMSRLHACIYSHRGRAWVADLQSHNGSRYQERALEPGQPVPLRAGGDPVTLHLYDQAVQLQTMEA